MIMGLIFKKCSAMFKNGTRHGSMITPKKAGFSLIAKTA